MALKNVFIALGCATVQVWSGFSLADEYRPDEFLRLDLSTAVLSPKPLGPAAGFAPGPLDVTVDHGRDSAQARVEPAAERKAELKAEPKAEPKSVVHATRVVQPPVAALRHPMRTKLARHLRNPLDAQASDARIQVWPCKSSGICNWKR